MKKIFSIVSLAFFSVTFCFAQKGKSASVSIFGDSYSTFEGYLMPEQNAVWYFEGRGIGDNDVRNVEQTWWHQLLSKNGWKLCVNNSYSGSTISSSGYGGEDYTDRSFVTRAAHLGSPDIIFIFGATNDSWVPAPIGQYKYGEWTKDDFKAFRPSLAKMLDYMVKRYLNTDIYFILNSELSDSINVSVRTICEHYAVPVIVLHDIDKKMGHPSVAGMKAIAEQVDAFVRHHSAEKAAQHKVRRQNMRRKADCMKTGRAWRKQGCKAVGDAKVYKSNKKKGIHAKGNKKVKVNKDGKK